MGDRETLWTWIHGKRGTDEGVGVQFATDFDSKSSKFLKTTECPNIIVFPLAFQGFKRLTDRPVPSRQNHSIGCVKKKKQQKKKVFKIAQVF